MAVNQINTNSHWVPPETKIVDGCPVRFRDVCVKTIYMSDAEDPDVMIAAQIWIWQNSDVGQWLKANTENELYWTRHIDYNSLGYEYKIMARLSEQNETFWRLKWGGIK